MCKKNSKKEKRQRSGTINVLKYRLILFCQIFSFNSEVANREKVASNKEASKDVTHMPYTKGRHTNAPATE